jgi:hypothetical protein
MLLVRGKRRDEVEPPRRVEITSLEAARERAVREVEIRLAAAALGKVQMHALASVLDRHPGDRRVSFVVDQNGQGPHLRTRVATARRIKPSDQFVRDVEAVCGSGAVTLK